MYCKSHNSSVSVAVWWGASATGQERETRVCQCAVQAQDTRGTWSSTYPTLLRVCVLWLYMQVVHCAQNVNCAYWVKLTAHVIGGGTWGGHQGLVSPLGKDFLFSAPLSNCLVWWPFWPHSKAGTRAVMAQWSLNMASSVSKTLGPSILAASRSNYKFSTNMASEAISEHLI